LKGGTFLLEIRALKREDREEIREILEKCNVFTKREIDVATELIDLCLSGSSDYNIEVLSDGKKVIGYICYGENPIASGIWELYWICVNPSHQGKGYGETLLKRMEEIVKEKGGRAIFIETSSLPSYERARNLYERSGYKIICIIKDFYKIGDHKIIYRKDIENS
jgi:ribosomal protein S18 acetylase RimI-like enzyme